MKQIIIWLLICALVLPALLTQVCRADDAPTANPCGSSADKAYVREILLTDRAGHLKAYTPTNDEKLPHVKLGDAVGLRICHFEVLQGQLDSANSQGAQHKLVLFLNGRAITDVESQPVAQPGSDLTDVQTVMLKKTAASSSDAWSSVLSSPGWEARSVVLSIGIDNGSAIQGQAVAFNVLPHNLCGAWLGLLLVLLIGFLVLAHMTDLLRDSGAATDPTARRRFSLARTQAAWWFFLILASYLFIGIVTGDFSASFNSTATTLLGISAATTVGSAFIDASSDTPANRSEKDAVTVSLQAEAHQISQNVDNLKTQLTQNPGDLQIKADLANSELKGEQKQAQLAKLRNESEDFIQDILSDANGVNFHRFQILAWTVVLGVIFVADVYAGLAMPDFNATLLGLMGISAGTYLGLKIPEDGVPKR